MRIIPCDGDDNTKFTLPGWFRVLDDAGQSVAYFRHAVEADVYLMNHGFAKRLSRARVMGAMLHQYHAVSFRMANMTAQGINGFRGIRQDRHSKSVTFLFDDGSEFPFTPTLE